MSEFKGWALILGASSGFGKSTSLHLAKAGYNIIGVHLDRKDTLPLVEEIVHEIENSGRRALFFNKNAADQRNITEILDSVKETLEKEEQDKDFIKVFLHSLAFGTLRPFISENPEEMITKQQMEMTLDVMANSLVWWVQELFKRKLIRKGSKIFAMTSIGSQRVFPYYGAISASKACLESHIRQLALELAPYGITANAIRAGVTDTPALRKIPNHEKLLDWASKNNPMKRITTPDDIARAIAALCNDDLYWATGNVINVDGGEAIV